MEKGKECGVTIRFDLTKVDLDQVFRLEGILREMGVRFDTGTGCGGRDWNWDTALKGPVSVLFMGDMEELRRE